jgi:Transcription factor WhiB
MPGTRPVEEIAAMTTRATDRSTRGIPRISPQPGLIWAPPPPWTEQALCAQADPDTWFPRKGQNDLVRTAKKVCARCPVRIECLDHALTIRDPNGIWGGTSPEERRALLAEQEMRAA